MQYSVPQFVEVEDKIIGSLSLRQFLILLFGGLLCLAYWSLFGLGVVFFVLALPTVGIFAFLSFGIFNGRSAFANFLSAIHFFSAPRLRVFERTGEKPLMMVKKAPPKILADQVAMEPVKSRLRRLAYLLDQKTAEEERLIHSGQLKEKWLNEI